MSASTLAEAEKLVQFPMAPAHRETAAGNWRRMMAPLYERRNGPRRVSIPSSVAPAAVWDPVLPGQKTSPEPSRFVRSRDSPCA